MVYDKVLVFSGLFLALLFIINMGLLLSSNFFEGLEKVEDVKRNTMLGLFGIGQMGLYWYSIEFFKQGLQKNTKVGRNEI